MAFVQSRLARASAAVSIALLPGVATTAQQPDAAAVIHLVDSEVADRVANVLGFTDIEHYFVYRGNDESHPVAEMTVKDAYTKGAGKTYTILSQSGSADVMRFGLKPLLDNEQIINLPENVEKSWFTSANYRMNLKPGGVEKMNGRECYALEITPRQKAPNMINGTLWVDARDGSIVQVSGVASKSPSIFAGTTRMMRQYVSIGGYPMATHARAESNSFLFGRTVVVIDYSDYHLQVKKSQ